VRGVSAVPSNSEPRTSSAATTPAVERTDAAMHDVQAALDALRAMLAEAMAEHLGRQS
jgi:hypothetical protein